MVTGRWMAKIKIKDGLKRPDRSAGVRPASDFGLSAVRRKDGHGHRKVIH